MNNISHKPIEITKHFYQLGTNSFPAYLSLGDNGMLLEGGTGATFSIIVEQVKALGIAPERIKYLALSHTHADHIGAIPHIRKIWPHIKILASPLATKLLKNEKTVNDFIAVDRSISKIMFNKNEISEYPPDLEKYEFHIDRQIEEGDMIDLGSGIIWTVYNTPGHSACHISFYEEKEKTLMIGDATGFYVPEKDVFWPNYFEALEPYCKSIRKLSALSAKRAALCHNGVIQSGLKEFFQKAIQTTDIYHHEMIKRIESGEDQSVIATEKAQWVNSLTDIQTFEVMLRLAKLLIMKSQAEAHKENLFSVPLLIK